MDNQQQITPLQRLSIIKNRFVNKFKASLVDDKAPVTQLMVGDMPTVAESRRLGEVHTLSGLLPYESYDEENDLFFNKQSVGFVLYCLPACGLDDASLTVLNGIYAMQHPTDVTIQISLFSDPNVEGMYDAWKYTKSKCANAELNEIFSLLAEKRTEYYKSGKWDSLYKDQAILPRNYHLIISYTLPVALGESPYDIDEAGIEQLLRVRESMMGGLSSAGIQSIRMNSESFINLMNGMLNPSKNRQPYIKYDDNQLISEQIVSEDTAVLFGSGLSSVIHNDDKYSIIPFHIRQLPNQWLGYKNRDLLGSYTNNILRMPCPMLITMTVTLPDQVSQKGRAKRKAMRATQMASSPVSKYVPQWKDRKLDWDFAQRRLKEGDKLVDAFYQILLFAPHGKEQVCEEALKGVYGSIGWVLSRSRYIPIPSFLGALPMGIDPELQQSLKQLRHYSSYLSWTCTNTAPWIAEWKGTTNPLMMFMGRLGQVTFFDPFDNTKGNFNISCCAASGAGKSFFTNEWVFSCLGYGGRAFIIDAGHSYRELCSLMQGTYIDFGKGQPVLNPFTNFYKKEVIDEIERKGLSLKEYTDDYMPLLKLLIGQMASPDRDLTNKQKAILEMAINAAIEKYRDKTTITKVAEECLNIQGDDGKIEVTARDLSMMLHSYTKDGMYGRYFEGDNNINMDNSMVVLELDALNAKGDLQSVVLLILMMQINQVMYLSGNKKQRKLCIIDEAWRLLGKGRAGAFIEEGYRVARKHGGSFMTVTQKVSDYYTSETAKAAYANSDFQIFLRQNPESLSEAEAKGYIDNSTGKVDILRTISTEQGKYSEVAINSPSGLSVVRFIVDPVTEKIYSTTADEVEFIRNSLLRGVNIFDAINDLIARDKSRNKGR